MNVIVRKAVVADAHAVAAAESAYIDCPWTESQIVAEIGSESAVFLVAEADGEFCGYVSGNIALDECEMSNIAVTAERRGQGVGKMLMTALLGELSKRHVSTVFLLVRDGNSAAVKLYEKCGFTVVGTRKDYYKGKAALIMRLNL